MTDASGDPPAGDPPPDAPLTRRDAAEPAQERAAAAEPRTPAFQSHVRAARSEFENQVAQARAEFEEANERIKAAHRARPDRRDPHRARDRRGADRVADLPQVALRAVRPRRPCMLGIFEFGRALIGAGRRVDLVPQLVIGAVLVLSGYFVDLWLHWVAVFVAVALVIVWRLVAQMFAKDGRTYGAVLGDVLIAGFIQLYVPFLASLCLDPAAPGRRRVVGARRSSSSPSPPTPARTRPASSFGKHPMAPRISPKKTWEGFAGAVARRPRSPACCSRCSCSGCRGGPGS